MAFSFTGRGNRSTRRLLPICHQLLTTSSYNGASSTPRHQRDLNSQLIGDRHWFAKIVVNPTTIWSRPWRPPIYIIYDQRIQSTVIEFSLNVMHTIKDSNRPGKSFMCKIKSFLPLWRHLNPADPVVEKSVIL